MAAWYISSVHKHANTQASMGARLIQAPRCHQYEIVAADAAKAHGSNPVVCLWFCRRSVAPVLTDQSSGTSTLRSVGPVRGPVETLALDDHLLRETPYRVPYK